VLHRAYNADPGDYSVDAYTAGLFLKQASRRSA
jgi:hypothetical protein